MPDEASSDPALKGKEEVRLSHRQVGVGPEAEVHVRTNLILKLDHDDVLHRKQLVSYVARSGGESNAARLAPDRFIDLVLIANCKPAGGLSGDENCIAHSPA